MSATHNLENYEDFASMLLSILDISSSDSINSSPIVLIEGISVFLKSIQLVIQTKKDKLSCNVSELLQSLKNLNEMSVVVHEDEKKIHVPRTEIIHILGNLNVQNIIKEILNKIEKLMIYYLKDGSNEDISTFERIFIIFRQCVLTLEMMKCEETASMASNVIKVIIQTLGGINRDVYLDKIHLFNVSVQYIIQLGKEMNLKLTIIQFINEKLVGINNFISNKNPERLSASIVVTLTNYLKILSEMLTLPTAAQDVQILIYLLQKLKRNLESILKITDLNYFIRQCITNILLRC